MNRVPEDGIGIAHYRTIIGFNRQRLSGFAPLIELIATPEQLEFRARFGFGRFVAPWIVERARVTKVFRVSGSVSDCIAIQGSDDLDRTIYSTHPGLILLRLEALGYPVDWLRRP